MCPHFICITYQCWGETQGLWLVSDLLLIMIFINTPTGESNCIFSDFELCLWRWIYQSISNIEKKVSFKILMRSTFQNCPWFLCMVENWLKYSRLKTMPKIRKDTVTFSCGCIIIVNVIRSGHICFTVAPGSKYWSILGNGSNECGF